MLATRARRRQTATAIIRSWRSQDGRYCLEEISSLFGLPRYYVVVERLRNGNQTILSRHPRRPGAVKALERLI